MKAQTTGWGFSCPSLRWTDSRGRNGPARRQRKLNVPICCMAYRRRYDHRLPLVYRGSRSFPVRNGTERSSCHSSGSGRGHSSHAREKAMTLELAVEWFKLSLRLQGGSLHSPRGSGGPWPPLCLRPAPAQPAGRAPTGRSSVAVEGVHRGWGSAPRLYAPVRPGARVEQGQGATRSHQRAGQGCPSCRLAYGPLPMPDPNPDRTPPKPAPPTSLGNRIATGSCTACPPLRLCLPEPPLFSSGQDVPAPWVVVEIVARGFQKSGFGPALPRSLFAAASFRSILCGSNHVGGCAELNDTHSRQHLRNSRRETEGGFRVEVRTSDALDTINALKVAPRNH